MTNSRMAVDFFCTVTPCCCTGLRQLGQRARHPVLHQHLREVEVRADLERHGQRVAAVGRAVGLHVEHALDAVDLLLDRQRDGLDERCGRWRPDSVVVTWTVGGVTCGYCATGSENSATPPIRIITTAMTFARTGRSMKNFEIMAGRYFDAVGVAAAGSIAADLGACSCGSTF